eukprot:SAG31_NODE_18772_length_623_cov_1.074427_1_plen_99_part_00
MGFLLSGQGLWTRSDFEEGVDELEEVAAEQSSSDLYQWSGAEWRSHWRQRLSLRLVTGQAAVVLGVVESTRNSARGTCAKGAKASLEWTATGCCPCVA